MDESFIGYYLTDKKGYIVKELARGSENDPPPSQDLNLAKKRIGVTYIGLIADKQAVQAVLPQVIIGGKKIFQNGVAGSSMQLCLLAFISFVQSPNGSMSRR